MYIYIGKSKTLYYETGPAFVSYSINFSMDVQIFFLMAHNPIEIPAVSICGLRERTMKLLHGHRDEEVKCRKRRSRHKSELPTAFEEKGPVLPN